MVGEQGKTLGPGGAGGGGGASKVNTGLSAVVVLIYLSVVTFFCPLFFNFLMMN